MSERRIVAIGLCCKTCNSSWFCETCGTCFDCLENDELNASKRIAELEAALAHERRKCEALARRIADNLVVKEVVASSDPNYKTHADHVRMMIAWADEQAKED